MNDSDVIAKLRKRCPKCCATKPHEEFSKNSGKRDGLQSYCKSCHGKNNAVYNRTPRGRAFGRARARRAHKLHPEVSAAINDVRNALISGHLDKPALCQFCGKHSAIEGHHRDYSKPLDVQWLCKPCHIHWHSENNVVRSHAAMTKARSIVK